MSKALRNDSQDNDESDLDLHALLTGVCDEKLTADEAVRLADRLREEPAARRFYVRYLDMHARLMGLPGLIGTSHTRERPWARVVSPALVERVVRLAPPLAAASLAALGMVLLLWKPTDDPANHRTDNQELPVPAVVSVMAEPQAATVNYVATVASASIDAQLGGRPAVAGGRLPPTACAVTAGSVTLRFDGGAEIFFDTGSRFRITSRHSLEVEEGVFVFQGDATCEPLTITTPQATLIDVGTQYAGVVKPGAEELHVIDGAVRRSGTGPEEFVPAGVGRVYDVRAPQGRIIPIDSALVRRSAQAKGSPPVALPPIADDTFVEVAESIGGLTGGLGWRGGWVTQRGRPAFAVGHTGLGPVGSGAIEHRGGGSRAAHRCLEQPIDLGTDGLRYVRYLVRREADLPGDKNLAMLVLRKHGLTVAEEVSQQSFIQLAVCRDDTVSLKFRGASVRSSTALPAEATMAVVAKVVSGRERPDQISMRVMPVARLGDQEPEAWTSVTASIATDLVFDQISVEVASRGQVWIDDIVVGPSWASIALPREGAP